MVEMNMPEDYFPTELVGTNCPSELLRHLLALLDYQYTFTRVLFPFDALVQSFEPFTDLNSSIQRLL